MKGSRRRGGWCVLPRFKRLPRTFVSRTEVHGTIRASLFLSLVVEWVSSSFPSLRFASTSPSEPGKKQSSYNEPLRIGTYTRFSQTRLSTHTREQSKIFVPDFAPPSPPFCVHSFARAERRKEGRREKKRQRGSEIKRWRGREKENSDTTPCTREDVDKGCRLAQGFHPSPPLETGKTGPFLLLLAGKHAR